MKDLKGTSKLHGIERNSPDRHFEYSRKGWQFKKDFERYKRKYSSFHYEYFRNADGEIICRRHPN